MACSRAGAAGEDVLPVCFQPGEEVGVAEQAVFGDLGIAGAEFARRQRVEQRGVGDHQDRLVEGADQILAVARIDAGLAADRGIRPAPAAWSASGRIEPAPHRCRGKAGEIADHAAAERDDEIAALDARRDQRLADASRTSRSSSSLRPAGTTIARGLDAGRSASAASAAAQMMRGDGLVGDDRHARAAAQRRDARAERWPAGRGRSRCRRRARRARRCTHRRLAGRSGAVMAPLRRGAARCLSERGDDLVDDDVVRHVARLHGEVGLARRPDSARRSAGAASLPDRRS